MRRISLILLLTWLLAACTLTAEPADSAPAAELPTAQPADTAAPPPVVTVDISHVESPTAVPDSEPATAAPTTQLPTATPGVEENAAQPGVVSGRTEEGAFFLGSPEAPITHIDYSDFLWGSCRAYVLGTEPEIIANYVETGRVKLVFWPVLNHGDPSVYSTLTAECVGQQNPDLFWEMHAYLFENQASLWSADRDYYIKAATAIGADQAAFEACYDGPDGIATVLELDAIRRQRSIFSQPVFDINGQIFVGAQPYENFAAVFDAAP